MTIYETLRRAISLKQCVRVLAAGRARDLCPHALGVKGGKPRLLAFQYEGGSASGLAPGGEWRSFYLHEIAAATLIAGTWHTAHNLLAKAEACLDRIEYQVGH